MAKHHTAAISVAAAAGAFGALVAWGELQGSMGPSMPLGLAMVVLSFFLGPLVLLAPIVTAIGVGCCVAFVVYLLARVLLYEPRGEEQETAKSPPASKVGIAEGPPESGDSMDVYGITFDGAKYSFREFQYEKLEDAINYAKIVRRRGGA
jgi:hypothetical protein